jgi:hypothetical protein
METTMASPVFSWLVMLTFIMLLSVTIGIIYLTTSEWRDRRRREKEAKR